MKRDKILKIRLSSDEKTNLTKKSQQCALSLSSYSRTVLIKSTPKAAMTERERELYKAAYEVWVWIKKFEILIKNATKGMTYEQRYNYLKSAGFTSETSTVLEKIFNIFKEVL